MKKQLCIYFSSLIFLLFCGWQSSSDPFDPNGGSTSYTVPPSTGSGGSGTNTVGTIVPSFPLQNTANGTTNLLSLVNAPAGSIIQSMASGIWTTNLVSGDFNILSNGVATIQPGVVTLAKMANIATARLIGRGTAGTGVPEALTLGSGFSIVGGAFTFDFNLASGTGLPLTTGVTGTLPVANGGTGATSFSTNQLLVGKSTGPIGVLAAGTSTQLLHGNASGLPTWSAVDLANDVTGTLPVGKGGTGATSLSTNQILLGASTGPVAPLGSLGTSVQVLHGNASGAPSFGAVNLATDTTGTLPQGSIPPVFTNSAWSTTNGTIQGTFTVNGVQTNNGNVIINGVQTNNGNVIINGNLTVSTNMFFGSGTIGQATFQGFVGRTNDFKEANRFFNPMIMTQTVANAGLSNNIDHSLGTIVTIIATNATPTLIPLNPVPGSFTYTVVNGVSGVIPSFPSTFKWPGGTAPSAANYFTNVNATNMFSVLYDGLVYRGSWQTNYK